MEIIAKESPATGSRQQVNSSLTAGPNMAESLSAALDLSRKLGVEIGDSFEVSAGLAEEEQLATALLESVKTVGPHQTLENLAAGLMVK